MKEYRKGSRNV